MADDRKQKLVDLGADKLAEALLKLSQFSDEADNMVKKLISTKKENLQRFKRRLASLKRSKSFIDWRKARELSIKLEAMIEDLRAGTSDPLTGIMMLAEFYKTDNAIFGRCDDSSGFIGMFIDI